MSNDNIANLLDANLDDLADLPEFVTPPAGAYKAEILSLEEKKVGENSGVEAKFKLLETLELANATDTPVVPGTETSIFFNLQNEFGQGAFKEFMKPLANATGKSNLRELMGAAKGMQLMLVTKVRSGKKGTDSEDKKYLGIHKVEVL